MALIRGNIVLEVEGVITIPISDGNRLNNFLSKFQFLGEKGRLSKGLGIMQFWCLVRRIKKDFIRGWGLKRGNIVIFLRFLSEPYANGLQTKHGNLYFGVLKKYITGNQEQM